MLWSSRHGDATPSTRPPRPGPVAVLSLEFGRFPEITPLNPRFLADRERLKLTLEVDVGEGPIARPPAAFIDELNAMLPSLALHRCCGDNRIRQTFFVGESRHACATSEGDVTVDIAHLLEHLIIDLQHDIADMTICSGVTCGHERPRHRYDLFVESPGRGVSRLCVDLARRMMNDLLGGVAPDRSCLSAARLARQFLRSPGHRLDADAAARLTGGPCAADALSMLRAIGFISEIETSIDFSRAPIYELTR